ncbi:uncharacterized protein CTRU02_204859 [Colletotrichum truncatum]|uniref:Uncharacterized protein n=1 Tax=Colletotrichum truncatum TaxID=5467 RepID=A0ACC3ZDB3_COLTU
MKTAYATFLLALFAGGGFSAPINTKTSPNPAFEMRRRQFHFLNCSSPALFATCANYNTRCNSAGYVRTDYQALCGEPNCNCVYYGGCDTICREAQEAKGDPKLVEEVKSEEMDQT